MLTLSCEMPKCLWLKRTTGLRKVRPINISLSLSQGRYNKVIPGKQGAWKAPNWREKIFPSPTQKTKVGKDSRTTFWGFTVLAYFSIFDFQQKFSWVCAQKSSTYESYIIIIESHWNMNHFFTFMNNFSVKKF